MSNVSCFAIEVGLICRNKDIKSLEYEPKKTYILHENSLDVVFYRRKKGNLFCLKASFKDPDQELVKLSDD